MAKTKAKRVHVGKDERTSCCAACTSVGDDGMEYCKGCYRNVTSKEFPDVDWNERDRVRAVGLEALKKAARAFAADPSATNEKNLTSVAWDYSNGFIPK